MTPSEREEIREIALKEHPACIEDIDNCSIYRAILTQVEKARLEGIALGIGWAHTNSCLILDNGGDPRKVDIPTQLEKAFDDLERNKLNQKGE